MKELHWSPLVGFKKSAKKNLLTITVRSLKFNLRTAWHFLILPARQVLLRGLWFPTKTLHPSWLHKNYILILPSPAVTSSSPTYLCLISSRGNSIMPLCTRVAALHIFQEMCRSWRMTWLLSNPLSSWAFPDCSRDSMRCSNKSSVNFKASPRLLWNTLLTLSFKTWKSLAPILIGFMIESSSPRQKRHLEASAD